MDILPENFEAEVEAELVKQMDAAGKARYEWAHEMTNRPIETPWEELDQEAKERVFAEMRRYSQEMQQLGNDISSGKVKTGLAAVIASNL